MLEVTASVRIGPEILLGGQSSTTHQPGSPVERNGGTEVVGRPPKLETISVCLQIEFQVATTDHLL